MNREYHHWFSTALGRDMELLAFGYSGTAVLFFPTRTARFYDYENWKVIDALHNQINAGELQVYCVDSIDHESFYCTWCHPSGRINRHLQYDQYILHEVIPFIKSRGPASPIVSAGCSMGAYHAVNMAFKYPGVFKKVVGMSGRYDLTAQFGSFKDLFDGYRDENIYFNMPAQFIANLTDPHIIEELKKLEIIFAIGIDDAFIENNRLLSSMLTEKGINNSLNIWNEEAHKPRYWRKMVQLYL